MIRRDEGECKVQSAECKVKNVEPPNAPRSSRPVTLHSSLCTRHSSLRSRFTELCCLAVFPGLLAAVADEPPPAGHTPTSSGFYEFPATEFLQEQHQARQAADAALRQFETLRISPKFDNLPLDQAIQELAKLTKTPLKIDAVAFAADAVSAENTEITYHARRPRRVTDVLDRMLQPHWLSWQLDGNVVLVTTRTKQLSQLETRSYRIESLLRFMSERDHRLPESASTTASLPERDGRSNLATTARLLEEALPSVTSGPWGTLHGEGGALPRVFGDQLLVTQSPSTHSEVAAVLRALERVVSQPFGSPPRMVTEFDDDEAESLRLQRLLETELVFDFAEKPLTEVAQWLSQELDEDVVLDVVSLTEEGVATDSAVIFSGRTSVRSFSQQALEPLGLALKVWSGTVFLTTSLVTHRPQTVIWDVADFLAVGHTTSSLISFLQDSTTGPWRGPRDDPGGTITPLPGGLLVIRHNSGIQFEIAALLGTLRKSLRAEAQSLRQEKVELQTRFHRARTKAEAEALQRVLPNLVAPSRWGAAGGRGLIGIAEDRLIIRQTNAVHEQIDRFLREYQHATPIGQVAK